MLDRTSWYYFGFIFFILIYVSCAYKIENIKGYARTFNGKNQNYYYSEISVSFNWEIGTGYAAVNNTIPEPSEQSQVVTEEVTNIEKHEVKKHFAKIWKNDIPVLLNFPTSFESLIRSNEKYDQLFFYIATEPDFEVETLVFHFKFGVFAQISFMTQKSGSGGYVIPTTVKLVEPKIHRSVTGYYLESADGYPQFIYVKELQLKSGQFWNEEESEIVKGSGRLRIIDSTDYKKYPRNPIKIIPTKSTGVLNDRGIRVMRILEDKFDGATQPESETVIVTEGDEATTEAVRCQEDATSVERVEKTPQTLVQDIFSGSAKAARISKISAFLSLLVHLLLCRL